MPRWPLAIVLIAGLTGLTAARVRTVMSQRRAYLTFVAEEKRLQAAGWATAQTIDRFIQSKRTFSSSHWHGPTTRQFVAEFNGGAGETVVLTPRNDFSGAWEYVDEASGGHALITCDSDGYMTSVMGSTQFLSLPKTLRGGFVGWTLVIAFFASSAGYAMLLAMYVTMASLWKEHSPSDRIRAAWRAVGVAAVSSYLAWLGSKFFPSFMPFDDAQILGWGLIFSGVSPIFLLLAYFTKPAVDSTPRCVHCGYDLTGNVSGTCPECGTLVSRPVSKEALQ